LSSTAQLGSAKIALAQLFSFIFFKMNEAGFKESRNAARVRSIENPV
jgi:hypothetical protein